MTSQEAFKAVQHALQKDPEVVKVVREATAHINKLVDRSNKGDVAILQKWLLAAGQQTSHLLANAHLVSNPDALKREMSRIPQNSMPRDVTLSNDVGSRVSTQISHHIGQMMAAAAHSVRQTMEDSMKSKASFKAAVPGNLATNPKPSTTQTQKEAVDLLKQAGILPESEKASDYPVLTASVARDVYRTLVKAGKPALAKWFAKNARVEDVKEVAKASTVMTAAMKKEVIAVLLKRKQTELATWASRNLTVAATKFFVVSWGHLGGGGVMVASKSLGDALVKASDAGLETHHDVNVWTVMASSDKEAIKIIEGDSESGDAVPEAQVQRARKMLKL